MVKVSRLNGLSDFFIAVLIILSTCSVWNYDSKIPITLHTERLLLIVLLFLANVILVFLHRTQLKRTVLFKLVYLLTVLLLFFPFSGLGFGEYTFFLAAIMLLSALYVTQSSNPYGVWNAIRNITFILAISSIVLYLLGTTLKLVPPTRAATFEWAGTRTRNCYFELLFESQFTYFLGQKIVRNCGIFTEAPMFNFILTVSLAYELFIEKHLSKKRSLILIIAILTSFSTTGIILLASMFTFKYAIHSSENNQFKIKQIVLPFIAILVFFLISEAISIKTTTTIGAQSTFVRYDHLISCVNTWLEHPIAGVGFRAVDIILARSTFFQGMSVGLAYMLACGGILYGSILFVPFILNSIDYFSKKKYNAFCFELSFLFVYFFTALTIYPVIVFYMGFLCGVDSDYEVLN